MKDPAVIDAYLGAHQDVDLGVVTGRYAGELPADAQELVETANSPGGLKIVPEPSLPTA